MNPTKVKVGPQLYRIIYRSRDEDGMLADGAYGYILDTQNLIVIDANAPLSKQRTTLWHELFHAAKTTFDNGAKPAPDLEFDELEHHFIGIWEASLLTILTDNPELTLWLTKEEEWKEELKRRLSTRR
jgi:hypothetical protein